MQANYERAEPLILADEGSAFTNNPKDPGGPTKLGVTQAALSEYLGRPVSVSEIQALTPSDVKPIYRAQYWAAVRGDECPSGVDYFLFDAAVQHGRRRAIWIIQKALGLNVCDGVFGPVTMNAVMRADAATLIERARVARVSFYRSLDKFPVFGTGWLGRLSRVATTCSFWARKVAA